MGANGAGKSTLLQLLQGHLKPTLGEVTCGLPIHRCRERVVLMPSEVESIGHSPSVREFVELGTMHPGLDRAAPTKQPAKSWAYKLSGRRLDALSVANNNVHFLQDLWFSLHECFCLMNLVRN